MADMRVLVSSCWPEAKDTVGIELVSLDGGPLPAFEAGAHIDVHLPDVGIRSYSLCGHPHDVSRYELGVLKDANSRGGSVAMHALSAGAVLDVDFPSNHFPMAPAGAAHVFFAGGIGITPFLAMTMEAQARGERCRMHYAVRGREKAAYLGRLQSMLGSQLELHVDEETGRHFDAGAAIASVAPEEHVYVCGPQAFMEAVLNAARMAGIDEARLHWEYFSADAAQPHDGDASFEVVLQSSGKTITVEAGQTIVQACSLIDVDVMVSCEQGVCGTCITSIIEGIPDHRDVYLTPQEKADGRVMLPCCSRSKTPRIVLDL